MNLIQGDPNCRGMTEQNIAAARETIRKSWEPEMFEVQSTNRDGNYVPSIPEPFFGLRNVCDCGARFWTREAYRGHYALKHILKLD